MDNDRKTLNLQTLPRLEDGRVRYPRGWFVLGESSQFKTGEVHSLRYFEQQLVAFRTLEGELAVLDAYCPHLGADLGKGGCVDKGGIHCPFHGWSFDHKGRCTGIPYASRIPGNARLRAWPVTEINQLALLWHDPDGGEPDYQIPRLDEAYADNWSDWNLLRLNIRTHPREVIENVADKAHFEYVHGFNRVVEFSNDYEDHMATQHLVGLGDMGTTRARATYYGPAYQITWMRSEENVLGQEFESRLLNAHIPIDSTNLHLHFGVMLKNQGDPALLEAYRETTQAGFEQDIAIWEQKLFRPEPIFCDGDGPLARCRRWYGQFCEPRSATSASPAPGLQEA